MTDLKHRLLARVHDDLLCIESALEDNLTPYLDLVSKTARHILFAGGKRLRPLLTVLCARLCGYRGNHEAAVSTIFEYLHAATLLHDDLIDGASLRRGKPSAHSLYGNSTAVLVGDFLLARSLSIAARTGKLEVIRTIATITENMSQAEIRQMGNKGRIDLTEEEYLQIIEHKTADLIRGACRVGALIADAPKREEERLADYGYCIGIAFQMADDLLDYVADTRVLGKQVGADLREGKVTLPLIHALRTASGKDRQRMVAVIQKSDFSPEDFRELVALLHHYGGILYARDRAARHVERAKSALAPFSPSTSLETLEMIAEYTLIRTH